MKDPQLTASGDGSEPGLPQYEPPCIKLLDEEEVLSSFQITQAGYSWWIY